jgi:hypothetical protein
MNRSFLIVNRVEFIFGETGCAAQGTDHLRAADTVSKNELPLTPPGGIAMAGRPLALV